MLKNLHRLTERPKELQASVFQRFFDFAEIAGYSKKEYEVYKDSLKDYWDFYATIDSAEKKAEKKGEEKGIKIGHEQGLEQGKKEEKLEIARNAIKKGLDTEIVTELTGLSKEEIEKLRK